jgi:hypothetical protein
MTPRTTRNILTTPLKNPHHPVQKTNEPIKSNDQATFPVHFFLD